MESAPCPGVKGRPGLAENADFVIENGILIKYSRAGGSIRIPAGVTAIRRYALFHCDVLTEVSIPKSVTDIGEGAFSGCSALAKVTLPEGVTQIGGCEFKGCKALERIVIPAGATDIGDEAFRDCVSLSEITIPESVARIGKRTFEFCTALRYIAIVFSRDGRRLIAFPHGRRRERYDIPGNVTDLLESAFDKAPVKLVFVPPGMKCIPTYTSGIENCPCFASGDPVFTAQVGRNVYLGALDELPKRQKRIAREGFLTALEIGMPELAPWKDDYVDYIRQEYTAYEKKAWRNETLLRLLM